MRRRQIPAGVVRKAGIGVLAVCAYFGLAAVAQRPFDIHIDLRAAVILLPVIGIPVAVYVYLAKGRDAEGIERLDKGALNLFLWACLIFVALLAFGVIHDGR